MKMKHPFLFQKGLCILSLGLLLVSVIRCKVAKNFNEVNDKQVAAMERLSKRSSIIPQIDFDLGIPRFVKLMLPLKKDDKKDPVTKSLELLKEYEDLFRLSLIDLSFAPKRIVQDSFSSHVFLAQVIDSIPVFGAEYSIHYAKDIVYQLNGIFLTNETINNNTDPQISPYQAWEIAVADKKCAESGYFKPELNFFNARLFMNPKELIANKLDANTYLAYKVVLNDCADIEKIVFVDAINGRIIYQIEMRETIRDLIIRSAPGSRIFSGSGHMLLGCGYPGAVDWYNENGVLPNVSPDANGRMANTNINRVYNYFRDNLNRLSMDGRDMELVVTVNVRESNPKYSNSAWFSHSCNDISFTPGNPTLDIMAHEFTHGITKYSSGLVYQNQSGALNESYSDVFGMLIDDGGQEKYLIGEGAAIGVRRSLAHPPAYGQPDHFEDYHNTSADNGGVHTNSGIPNKVAYLIYNGGEHNGVHVRGIGAYKTSKLYYYVLTSLLTGNANFSDAANATIEQARRFAGQYSMIDRNYGFTDADVCAVRNAFASVGLPLVQGSPTSRLENIVDLDCDGIPDAQDSDLDGDGFPNSIDNCANLRNPTQNDMDGDGAGDVCDTDIDGDGIPNSEDNCPTVPDPGNQSWNCEDADGDRIINFYDNCISKYNPGQADLDGDGIGDACDDDKDNDRVLNLFDNCPTRYNPDQMDSDNDNIGDLCDNCINVPNQDQGDANSDGRGTACDDIERISNYMQIIDFEKLKIPSNDCRKCGKYFDLNSRIVINVLLNNKTPLFVIDNDRNIIAKSMNNALEHSIRFYPGPGSLFEYKSRKSNIKKYYLAVDPALKDAKMFIKNIELLTIK